MASTATATATATTATAMATTTAIFVDGANTYGAAIRLNIEVDYMKVLEYWKPNLLRAFYYTALKPAEEGERDTLRGFATFLSYNGYRVVTKVAKTIKDEATGTWFTKGNMDIELAIDMLRTARHIKHAILFSGDGDFRRLVEAVQDEGVHVTVVSTRRSSPPTAADELLRQADEFLDLADPQIQEAFCRPRPSRS